MRNSGTAPEPLLPFKTNYTQETRGLANRSVAVLTPASWKNKQYSCPHFYNKAYPKIWV
jgi:hypothetical protein